ncbi:unnamed protein product [Linum trigynum]|uniref:Uncharacterized protein n=1 Tax=Linum trigynum TaxID=586398 RepID=A0AAV2G1A1_9ROSI
MEARLRASTSSSQDKATKPTPIRLGVEVTNINQSTRRVKELQGNGGEDQGDGYQLVTKAARTRGDLEQEAS